MSDPIADLLDDAKLVVAYARKTGRLRDSALPDAIAKVSDLQQTTWKDQAVVDLQLRLSETIQQIAPTTVYDLRTEWQPHGYFPYNPRKTFLFGVLFALLALVAIVYTTSYNDGTAAVAKLQQASQDEIEQRFVAASWKVLGTDTFESITAGSGTLKALPVSAGQYQSGDEIFFDQLVEVRNYARQAYDDSTFVSDFLERSNDPVQRLVRYVAPLVNRQPPDQLASLPPYDPCSLADDGLQPGQLVLQASFYIIKTQKIRDDLIRVACLAEQNAPSVTPFNFPDLELLLQTAATRVYFLGTWVLPAIYGALGASLFYMRRIVDPNVADPGTLKSLLRIVVGALSGLVVVWFWAPGVHLSKEITELGLSVFSLAFLLGYSVDLLFAALDRVVTLGSNVIRRTGA